LGTAHFYVRQWKHSFLRVEKGSYSDTFWIPPVERRRNLEVGAIVKLIFRIQTKTGEEVERMWVQVKAKKPGMYIGALDNDPFCETELRAGAEVLFGPEHVIDIDDASA
jgi:uncharacterized protein YegJ (DUF2314 family)